MYIIIIIAIAEKFGNKKTKFDTFSFNVMQVSN